MSRRRCPDCCGLPGEHFSGIDCASDEREAKQACNADLGHPCDANDGAPCVSCAKYLAEVEAEARREWAAKSQQERDPEKYERDLRDAGRLP